MDVNELYGVARGVSRHFFIPGYDIEDLVQECVIKGLPLMEKPKSYVHKSMYNYLIDLLRKNKNDTSYFGQVEAAAPPAKWFPVPKSKGHRDVVYAMLVNDGCKRGSAKLLKMSRNQFRRKWYAVAAAIRNGEYEDRFLV